MDFTEFTAAATVADGQMGKLQGRIVAQLDAIDRILAIKAECLNGPGGVIEGLDTDRLLSDLWNSSVASVRGSLVSPEAVEIGAIDDLIVRALGVRCGEDALRSWSSSKIVAHFNDLFGDVRQVRIDQLRAKVNVAIRHYRPEKKWAWHMGEHHRESYTTKFRLAKTYRGENVANFENVVRFIVHLATGKDPIQIKVPTINCWNDGQNEWAKSAVYLTQKNPFEGCSRLRFTAGYSVEIVLDPKVLTTLQAIWDDAEAKRQHAEEMRIREQERERARALARY